MDPKLAARLAAQREKAAEGEIESVNTAPVSVARLVGRGPRRASQIRLGSAFATTASSPKVKAAEPLLEGDEGESDAEVEHEQEDAVANAEEEVAAEPEELPSSRPPVPPVPSVPSKPPVPPVFRPQVPPVMFGAANDVQPVDSAVEADGVAGADGDAEELPHEDSPLATAAEDMAAMAIGEAAPVDLGETSHPAPMASQIPSRTRLPSDPPPPPLPPPPADPPTQWAPLPPPPETEEIESSRAAAPLSTRPTDLMVVDGEWKPPPPPGAPPPDAGEPPPSLRESAYQPSARASASGLSVFPPLELPAWSPGALSRASSHVGGASGRGEGEAGPSPSERPWKPPPPPGAPLPGRGTAAASPSHPSAPSARPRALTGQMTPVAGAVGGGLGLPRFMGSGGARLSLASGGARGPPPLEDDGEDMSDVAASTGDEDEEEAAAGGAAAGAIAADGGADADLTLADRQVSLFVRNPAQAAAAWRAGAPHLMSQRALVSGDGTRVSAAEPAMCGYLFKMGGARGVGRAWHERYVVLRGEHLEYYLTQPDASLAGGGAEPKSKRPFPLEGANVVSPARRNALALGKHAALSFELKPPSTALGGGLKPLVFSAPSARVLQQWLVALHAAAAGPVPALAPSHLSSIASTESIGGESAASDEGVVMVSGRGLRTRREETEAAVIEEWALLQEELARHQAPASGGASTPGSAEAAAVARLIDRLRPFVPANVLSLSDERASVAAARPQLMTRISSLVSSSI